jgi:hypothetical protein
MARQASSMRPRLSGLTHFSHTGRGTFPNIDPPSSHWRLPSIDVTVTVAKERPEEGPEEGPEWDDFLISCGEFIRVPAAGPPSLPDEKFERKPLILLQYSV